MGCDDSVDAEQHRHANDTFPEGEEGINSHIATSKWLKYAARLFSVSRQLHPAWLSECELTARPRKVRCNHFWARARHINRTVAPPQQPGGGNAERACHSVLSRRLRV